MNSPRSTQRRIIPPTLPPLGERAAAAYTPPKYQPPRMDRWKRNLLVWTICAVIILLAVVAFVNLMLPPDSRRILQMYGK